MLGCLGRLGCLLLLAVAAVAGWISRERWLPRVTGAPPAPAVRFTPVGARDVAAARAALRPLEAPAGVVFAALSPVEAAALVVPVERWSTAVAGPLEAAVDGDRLLLRAAVDVARLPALGALGGLAARPGSVVTVTVGGTLAVASPGHGRFLVRDVRVRDLVVPGAVLDAVVGQLLPARATAAASASGAVGGGVDVPLPESVGDLRVARGRVVLYKGVP